MGRGIIPARAGFTLTDRDEVIPGQDHPRSRGVYDWERPIVGDAPGSSPLARGLLRAENGGSALLGIIPARAGFTGHGGRSRPTAADHPRSRGVYLAVTVGTATIAGSSPLARGLHHGRRTNSHRLGIIPARAGFTSSPVCARRHVEDHPRSRGVYIESKYLGSPSGGSSPLARGLLGGWEAFRPRGRIIPARAGFT